MRKVLLLLFMNLLFYYEIDAQVFIKADRFYPFSEGVAIVGYKNSQGVIGQNGNFIIPYNKYHFEKFGLGSLEPEHGFINGGCVVRNPATGLLGMIDREGKLIIPDEYILIYPFDREGWARVTDRKENSFFMNRTGTKIPIAQVFYAYRSTVISSNGGLEDLFNGGPSRNIALSGREYHGSFSNNMSPGRMEDGSYSYFNRHGKQVIKDKFAAAEAFANGLACVGKVNEFGEVKYGYIDGAGKQIIPFIYSNKPGNFSCGLAFVEPASKEEFDFAFIDIKGQIVFKQKSALPISNSARPQFEEGYFRMLVKDGSSRYLRIIDSTGAELAVIRSLKEKINSINQSLRGNAGYYPFTNQTQIFGYTSSKSNTGVGFVNLRTGQVILTEFVDIGKFDSLTGLAVAVDSKSGRESYIDQTGKVRIAMEGTSKW